MSKLVNDNRSVFLKMVLLLIVAGFAVFLVSPVFAVTVPPLAGKGVVTITAPGSQAYYMGEEVVFSGTNTDSDFTYLFLTGPNLPNGGGKLTPPYQSPVSGDPGSFTVAKTQPDKTWEYTWYTYNGRLDAGSYTVYAVSTPESKDQFNDSTTYGTVSIVYKKPYITAGISPATISKGVPFTVSGVAEGVPPNVQVWILGKNYYSKSIEPVNADASFKYVVPQEVTSTLATGQYFAIVQHPMQNNRFDIDVSGDYVRSLNLDNGTNLFRISGPGNLQGSDAAEALITAISLQEAHDATYTNDTYTIIPFQVTDAGSQMPQANAAPTAPARQPTQHAPLVFAPVGAIVVIFGIVVWKRR